MSERKPGWYWVKQHGEWEPTWWDVETGSWWDEESLTLFEDDLADEIGPRIPSPDEPWATVPVQPDEAMIDAAFWAWGSTDVRSVYIDMISSAPKPEDT